VYPTYPPPFVDAKALRSGAYFIIYGFMQKETIDCLGLLLLLPLFFAAAGKQQFPAIESAAEYTGRPGRVAPGVQGLQASGSRFPPEQVIGCEAKQRLS
jgi:hypothetical protein